MRLMRTSDATLLLLLVQQLVKDHLSLEIQISDINTAHRLGTKRLNQTADKRHIIVKFCRRDVKRDVIMASKRQTNPRIYVNESLTPTGKSIYDALRKMKREHPTLVKGCSTIDGRVYAFTKPITPAPNARDQRHHITNIDSLKEFCRTFVKMPLDTFLQNWSATS